MTDRQKLIALINHEVVMYFAERIADHLITNGVTFATDTNVGDKFVPTAERLPDEFAQFLCVVIRPIRGGKYVREFRVLWCDYDHSWNCEDLIVTHWMPLPEPPKGE